MRLPRGETKFRNKFFAPLSYKKAGRKAVCLERLRLRKEQIMTISEKVAYLKGLAEGLNLDVDKSKEGKLISVMIGILEEIGLSIEDLEENALALGEEIDVLSDDLADVESVVFDEDEDDGDYFEVECPNCEEPILIDDEALAAGEVQCPNCETRFALDLSDDTVDADEDAE